MIQDTQCPKCGHPIDVGRAHDLCAHCLLQAAILGEPAMEAAGTTEATEAPGRFTAPSPSELSAVFDQFDVLELIGQGGMGAVYRARHLRLDRIVALKILPEHLSADPSFAERFLREAQALASLQHANIVSCFDYGEHDGYCFLVMEFVDGVNLRQAIRNGSVQPDQALVIVGDICGALQYAHDEGIVHRDVKPENILLDRRGRVKIADFGLAKMLRRTPIQVTLTNTNQVLGTFHYMAPEQFDRPLEVDHRADLYSLGVVFYELLTGQLPIGRFKLPSERSASDPRLDEVVLRSLEREPADRYQYADQIKTDLERVSRNAPVIPKPPVAHPKRTDSGHLAERQNIDIARQRLKWPSRALTLAGSLGLGLSLLTGFVLFPVVSRLLDNQFISPAQNQLIFLIQALATIQCGCAIFAGRRAGQLRRYPALWLMLASLMIPFGLAFIVLGFVFIPISLASAALVPLAIWLAIVLAMPSTRAAFTAQRNIERAARPPRPRTQLDASQRLVGLVFGLLLTMVVLAVLGGVMMFVLSKKSFDSNRQPALTDRAQVMATWMMLFRVTEETPQVASSNERGRFTEAMIAEVCSQRLSEFLIAPSQLTIKSRQGYLEVNGLRDTSESKDITFRLSGNGIVQFATPPDLSRDAEQIDAATDDGSSNAEDGDSMKMTWREIHPDHLLSFLSEFGDQSPLIRQQDGQFQFLCDSVMTEVDRDELTLVGLGENPARQTAENTIHLYPGDRLAAGIQAELATQGASPQPQNSSIERPDRSSVQHETLIVSVDDIVYLAEYRRSEDDSTQVVLRSLPGDHARNLAAVINSGPYRGRVESLNMQTTGTYR